MPEFISDGTGNQNLAKVDANNRLRTFSITKTHVERAVEDGDAYNLNTGNISISGASASSIIYLKNNEDQDLEIEAIAFGFGQTSSNTSDIGILTAIRAPSSGDIVSDATAVDINGNRNAGSPNTLTADVYKGKDGGTITGGSNVAQFFLGANSRLFANFPFTLPKGTTFGLKFDPNLSSGSVNVYGALVCHLADVADKNGN